METKDGLKRALMQEAEAGVLKLLEQLQKLPQGDLKGLEQQVMETIFEIGRGWMQSVLSEAAPEEQAPGERVGSCGQQQQLVGYRPKQVLTLLGKLTFNQNHETEMGEFWGQMVKDDRYPFAVMKNPTYLSQGPFTN